MKFCPDIINRAVEFLSNENQNYKNNILLGDNSSGKSEVIYRLIEKMFANHVRVYYIDSVNRFFNVGDTQSPFKQIASEENILKCRIDKDYFNLTDSFQMFGTVTDRIEFWYDRYEKQIQKLLFEFTGIRFSITHPESKEVTYEGDGVGKLSSGIQALVRIFLELCYLQEIIQDECIRVIIDEIDEFLSPQKSSQIVPFLIRKFPQMNFTVSTHSADLIRTAEDFKIVILGQEKIEIVDSNDFDSESEVSAMFGTVFGLREAENDVMEEMLRRLLNNRITGIWNDDDKKMMEEISKNPMTNAQKLLFRQIEEW